MAAIICHADIFFTQCGDLVVAGNNLSSVRVKYRSIFCPAVAGVAHCKMRSHLFCNQDRKFVRDAVFLSSNVGCRVGTDRKFTHRDLGVMEQDIVLDIRAVLFFCLKV